jgi:hypothetical protein
MALLQSFGLKLYEGLIAGDDTRWGSVGASLLAMVLW